jgi:Cu-Zn family superoxide dismutase
VPPPVRLRSRALRRATALATLLAATFAAGCAHRAVATIAPRSGTAVTGRACFTERAGAVHVVIDARGLTPGLHGVHVHATGDCSAPDAASAGPHFDPTGGTHAGPHDPRRHAGDLGNLEAGTDGAGTLRVATDALTVAPGPRSVVGRALVIHADPDDLVTQPSGASGARVGCGVIERAR